MNRDDYQILLQRAHEGFIRRSTHLDHAFMLKGSYVTRQYFPNPGDRIPADIDWVYMHPIRDQDAARQLFNHWVTQITETHLEDGIRFRSFKENEFWRRIDYAMADDFPTVNTDLSCIVDGDKIEFGMDISFNLEYEQTPVPLTYKPMQGESFLVQNTVPISLQVAWKIHQSLVRPRLKDFFDLTYVVQHPDFTSEALKACMQALVNECDADKISSDKIKTFLNHQFADLFPDNALEDTWNYWRHDIDRHQYRSTILYGDKASFITKKEIPALLHNFLKQLADALTKVGIDNTMINNLPKVNRNK